MNVAIKFKEKNSAYTFKNKKYTWRLSLELELWCIPESATEFTDLTKIYPLQKKNSIKGPLGVKENRFLLCHNHVCRISAAEMTSWKKRQGLWPMGVERGGVGGGLKCGW